MDDVLANYKRAFYARTLEVLPPELHLPMSQMESWSIVESYRVAHGDAVADQVQALTCGPGFFANLPIIPGALSALEGMLKRGYDVALLTAPLHKSPTCASEKLQWVEWNLGKSWLNRTIIASEKFRVDGDVLIDDNPHAAKAPKGLEPRWSQVLFMHEWNQAAADSFQDRMNNWRDWKRVVIPLLEQ